jgi:hypothetical protein
MKVPSRLRRSHIGFTALLLCLVIAVSAAFSTPVLAATSVDCSTDPAALQPAIDAAEPGDILHVTGTCFGNFTIDKDLTLHGTGTLDGNDAGPVVHIGLDSTTTILDLTITNGVNERPGLACETGAGGIDNEGRVVLGGSATVIGNSDGGIYNACETSLIVNDSATVTGNSGGGILNDFFSSITLNGSVSVKGNTGDGVHLVDGGLIMNASSSVSDNTGVGVFNGGDVEMNDSSSVITNLLGGIRNDCSSSMVMNDFASIHGNSVGGGIVWCGAFGFPLTLNDSASVTGNTSTFGGGGIRISDVVGPGVVLNDMALVSGNAAPRGGGIYLENFGRLTLNGAASISGNKSATRGGGIYNGDDSFVVLNNSSMVTGNRAGTKSLGGQGGGIWNGGELTLNDSAMIQGNKAIGPLADGGGVFLCMAFGGGVLNQNGGTIKGNKPNNITSSATC